MYSEKKYGVAGRLLAGTDDLDLAGAGASYPTKEEVFLSEMALRRVALVVTTAVVSTGPVVVNVLQRLAPGVAGGQVLLGTLSVPGGATVGQVYYKDLDDVKLLPGQSLVCQLQTPAAGGGAAGKAYFLSEQYDSPEAPLNRSAMIASA